VARWEFATRLVVQSRTGGLDLSTLVAVRFNPMLRAFYARLLGTGKPKRSPSLPRCENYSRYSTPSCAIGFPGGQRVTPQTKSRPAPPTSCRGSGGHLALDPQHSRLLLRTVLINPVLFVASTCRSLPKKAGLLKSKTEI